MNCANGKTFTLNLGMVSIDRLKENRFLHHVVITEETFITNILWDYRLRCEAWYI